MVCDRCNKKTRFHIMSMFNCDELCVACKEKERAHPEYKSARIADDAAIQAGNFDFPGVGKPADL